MMVNSFGLYKILRQGMLIGGGGIVLQVQYLSDVCYFVPS